MPAFYHQNVRLAYREAGRGPLLVLLPGNTSSSAHLVPQVEVFARHFHTAALDFRGTGQSQRLERWPEDWFDQAAADTVALIDHLGAADAFLVGTSGGAVVALLAAIRYPNRVRAVVADSTARRIDPAVLSQRDPDDPQAGGFWESAHGPDWPQVVAADSDMLLRFSQQHAGWFGGRLGEIRCPVLLTASLQDELLPEGFAGQILEMAREIPGCQALFNHDGSHPLMWSRPQVFYRWALSFLGAGEGN